jgi:predicted RNA-binding Zn-ribbon protein involved in translation (DUF1610 family)
LFGLAKRRQPRQYVRGEMFMRKPGKEAAKSEPIGITMHDVVFECPACGKSLVVDEAAVGLTVECPQCRINVIVPPKQTPAVPSSLGPPPPMPAAAGGKRSMSETQLMPLPFQTSAPSPAAPPPAAVTVPAPPPKPAAGAQAPPVTSASAVKADVAGLQQRLAKLADQLKELQTQRTELVNRVASRINDMNNDLVLLARVDTSQQQILSEWTQILNQLGAVSNPGESGPATTTSVLGANAGSGRTRVTFQA